MSAPATILHIAIFKPMRHCFDYFLPVGTTLKNVQAGMRVQVPFGKQQTLGIIVHIDQQPCIPLEKIKPATTIIDNEPLLSSSLIALYQFASRYYQYPIGETIFGTLPSLLKKISLVKKNQLLFKLSEFGQALKPNGYSKIPRQIALWQLFQASSIPLNLAEIKAAGFNSNLLKHILAKGWVESLPPCLLESNPEPSLASELKHAKEQPLDLNSYQQNAVTQVIANPNYKTYLLEGITGSGKTEVYLQIIAHFLQAGKQALVLIPEIGLTPQTIARFQRRFATPMAVLHSKVTRRERLEGWMRAKRNQVKVIIGTRSAVFVPFAKLGIIILDEEHDLSFKQQNGLRYSARDLAIARGRIENIPVVLGTATPSLESLHNSHLGRFQLLQLPQRAGSALSPSFHIIDLKGIYIEEGLSASLLQVIKQHLQDKNQVLIFLNRRGFAPALLCHNCGWSAKCLRCDAGLTFHQQPPRLICHHCTTTYKVPSFCGKCQTSNWVFQGIGTERLELALQHHFPTIGILRIDKDTVRGKKAMEKILQKIHQQKAQILIGTQMLAKGHHFPQVTLVCIINIDSGFYSTDFRAREHMGQLILQVAGRAGRAEKPGQVYLQTHHPDHPLLQTLIQQGYSAFAHLLLEERKQASWPPFTYLVLLRAEATKPHIATQYLTQAAQVAEHLSDNRIQILGPIPAPMERKAGFFRALLLLQCNQRQVLQSWLEVYTPQLETIKCKGEVRWTLEVDPIEMA